MSNPRLAGCCALLFAACSWEEPRVASISRALQDDAAPIDDGGGTDDGALAADDGAPTDDGGAPDDSAAPDLGAPPDLQAAGALVISQVYGAGGNASATYLNDYVELFNRSASPVSIAGWSIQYGSAAANFSDKADLPAATIPPGRYFLIQLGSGGAVGAALPAPDFTPASLFNMSASGGKVALVRSAVLLGCGAAGCSDPSIVDLVGYGSATAFEGTGAAKAASTNGRAIFRLLDGCVDTDDNVADFTTAPAAPRNSASPLNDCAALPDLGAPTDLSTAADIGTTDLPAVVIGPVVISQVYGAGGNAGAAYTSDYVELFNRGASPVSIAGWSLQYGSAAANFSDKADLPAVTIGPGQYFLIQLGSGGANGAALPAPDFVPAGAVNLSASSGKLALVGSTVLLGCGAAGCSDPSIVDLVGYGSSSAYEGTAAAKAPTNNARALFRLADGCVDTDDNAADFTTAPASPRNSASPLNDCTALPDLSATTDLSAAADIAADLPPVVVGPVVISQLYGAGGNTNATFASDYVELFNHGATDVSLAGWSIQYGSAAGNFSDKADLPSVSMGPGQYFLVQLASGANGAALPAPDFTGALNPSSSSGKVALVAGTTLLGCGAAGCSDPSIVDLVGYGSSTAFEGTGAAKAPSGNGRALFRLADGCVDTDDNAADFTTAAAAPRNSASPPNDCTAIGLDGGATSDMAASRDLSGATPDLSPRADLSSTQLPGRPGCTCAAGARAPVAGGPLLLLAAAALAWVSAPSARRSPAETAPPTIRIAPLM